MYSFGPIIESERRDRPIMMTEPHQVQRRIEKEGEHSERSGRMRKTLRSARAPVSHSGRSILRSATKRTIICQAQNRQDESTHDQVWPMWTGKSLDRVEVESALANRPESAANARKKDAQPERRERTGRNTNR